MTPNLIALKTSPIVKLIPIKYLPMETGTSIEFSKKMYNVVWLGSTANGFFRYDISTGNFKQYNFDSKNKFSPNNSINTIFEDRMGILWVATASNLIRFDPETEKIEKFDQKDGLPSNLVNSIVEDMQGNLWINTSEGLSKLNKNAPRDKWNFVNFDARDGLQGLGASKANWISKNGEIVLGGNDGLISFYPGKINEVKPDIVLEDIKISDVSLKSDSAAVKLQKSIMKLDELDLSYTQNNISFEFASIHFSRPEKNKIMYKLEGFNDHWISTDRNFVSFTNLNPGEYTFLLKGSNGDGIWNDKERAIKIIISPPWWKTTFAYLGYFFFFVGLVLGIDRVQRRRIVNKERNAAAIKEANLRAQLAESENERKTKELEEARQLQLSMLPKKIPQLLHLNIAVYMKTATEVGGDYYDFSTKEDGSLNICLGDATGHGMKAGTIVTMMKSLFTTNSVNKNLEEFFASSNNGIKDSKLERMMIAFAMLNINSNRLQIANAGIPPIYIYRKKNNNIEEIKVNGLPLGAMNNSSYELYETELFAGDTILILSDGMPELRNKNDEMYGYERVKDMFLKNGTNSCEEIIDKLKDDGLELGE